MSVRALVFDFDGVIIDTEASAFALTQAMYQEHGVELGDDVWHAAVGSRGYDLYEGLQRTVGRPLDLDRLRDVFAAQHAADTSLLDTMAGVRERIAEAQALGLGLAVASSSSREWVVGHLSRLGLIDVFDAVRTREDVEQTKPHPGLFLAALAALEVGPWEAIALEDSPNGVTAAKAAGIYTVAVPNSTTVSLPLGHADLLLASLANVTLSELVQRHSSALGLWSSGPDPAGAPG
jgi:HAD superfamily hydrolase (TIGR01509 family)